ncbi:MAG: Metalloendopeptidase-like protein membrane protein [Microgenomates group bacterium GW2011_GWA1_48_10]|nr:MAG: Metalloendopeptidase-like protein membrane protein [Microgenomates group bacterium GW2011_GWA1_48_10]
MVALLVAGLVGGYWMWQSAGKAPSPVEPKTNITNRENTNSQPANSQSETVKESDYVFPLPDYFSRIKVKRFGQLVKATDKFEVACGAEFAGYHTGDDLEVLPEEENTGVAVHAAASGKIRQVGNVSGYGGLVVQSASLAGEELTVYYGHLNVASLKVKAGDGVTAGEVLGYLGKGCSTETSGERKHLHFAIHKGSGIDVRGYVPGKEDLAAWLDPGETLQSLGAKE